MSQKLSTTEARAPIVSYDGRNWAIWKRRLCGFAQVNGWRKILDGSILLEDYGMDGDEEFVNPRTRRSYGSKTNQLSESSVVESSNNHTINNNHSSNSENKSILQNLKDSLKDVINEQNKQSITIDGLTR